jgi:hypothetical protein
MLGSEYGRAGSGLEVLTLMGLQLAPETACNNPRKHAQCSEIGRAFRAANSDRGDPA